VFVLALSVFAVAGVLYTRFDKASLYYCYYGLNGGEEYSNSYVLNLQDRSSGSKLYYNYSGNYSGVVDNIRCYPAGNDTPSCGPGYNSTVLAGYLFLSPADVAQINCHSLQPTKC